MKDNKHGRAAFVRGFVEATSMASLLLFVLLFSTIGAHAAPQQTDLKDGIDQRKVIDPSTYGDIVMNMSASGAAKPVVFKHWTHRTKFQCSVCHTDIAFPLKANTLEIKQSDIEAGKYCGACHDAKTAFGPAECAKCHSYGSTAGGPKIAERLADLPKDGFGNKINWVGALSEGKIKPSSALPGKPAHDMRTSDVEVVIPVTKYPVHPPDVVFPHKPHTAQLDCSSCHPAPFAEKAGGNPQMNMIKIISGQYCGTCHDRVSFPLNDCFRCHSKPAPPRPEEVSAEDEAAKKEPVKEEPKAKKPSRSRRRR